MCSITEKLKDGTHIYKIGVLYNNEYMMFFYTEAGQFDQEVENWLKEQAQYSKPLT